MTEKEIIHNRVVAYTTEYFDRTITVVCDERPGFEPEEAQRVIALLRENGYYVKDIGVDEFCTTDKNYFGFLVIIPHAMSLPAICSSKVRSYLEQGGSLLTFGGVLFGKYVEKVDGKWTEIPLPDNIFDAVHTGDGTKAKAEPIVIEGIVPTYKTYRCNDAAEFKCNSLYTNAEVSTDKPLKVVCPVPRAYGGGYNMEHRNRYIPITTIGGKSDRGDGSEGVAAFIMLDATMGHNPTTSIVYPGTVSMTALGSVAANIGIMDQNLMDIKGVPELILSIVKNLRTGLHIFNAGAEQYVYSDGERAVFGAKIHNSTMDYKTVSVHMTVEKGDECVYEYSEDILTIPLGYAECRFECENFKADEYIVKTELIFENEIIDVVTQEIHKKDVINAKYPDDFVRVEGRNFMLGDKLWYPIGMNYWPLYMPGFERNHYWLSWLDKSNYIPEEVEKDLVLMEKMGINCIFMRIDGDMFGRQKSTFEDFLWRLRRHNMKLNFAFPNVTMPVHYNATAFRKVMNDFSLINDPIIFCHDISWESDGALLATPYKRRYDDAWESWINDRYGSIENAEKDFGVPIDRRPDGHITVPEEEEFGEDGEWRIKICAYRRFMEDYFSKIWKVAIDDIRSVDPNHLVSYRRGPFGAHAKGVKVAMKHTDFSSHEAYHIDGGERGFHEMCADAAVFELLSKNKPLIMSEYGMTLTGMNRTNDFVWDHETERPMAYRMKRTENYNKMMQKAFMRFGVNGTAPWWWPGGLRMVEMSDCGYCAPDGILRSFGKDYADFIKEYYHNENKPTYPEYEVTVDFDATATGVYGVSHNCLTEHNIKAFEQGKVLHAVIEATGTTSADTPLKAVGNVDYNGSNPLKYLNGEFNYVRLYTEDGRVINVNYGDAVNVGSGKVYVEISLGNLKEATWLSPLEHDTKKGGVYVVSHKSSQLDVKIPIAKDVEFLEDTYCEKTLLCEGITAPTAIALHLTAENRADFGEVFRFTIK